MKCFDCGKIGHFAAMCPYTKDDQEDEQDKRKYYNKKQSFLKKKKNLCTKEETSHSEGSEESDSETLFMAIESTNFNFSDVDFLKDS